MNPPTVPQAPSPQRAAYASPHLRRCGTVSELTASGSQGAAESLAGGGTRCSATQPNRSPCPLG